VTESGRVCVCVRRCMCVCVCVECEFQECEDVNEGNSAGESVRESERVRECE